MVIGSVPYLNAVPLTWGLHQVGFRGTLVFAPPAQLAEWLAEGKIDVGLIPIAEYLRGVGDGVISNIGIASDGAVCSVLLVSKIPLPHVETVAVDRYSRSSVLLLRVLLMERYGLQPVLFPMEPRLSAMLARADAALLIGDAALEATVHPSWQVWDLGQEWKTLTGLPFVFAAWVIRNGAEEQTLARWLTRAKEEGIRNMDKIVAEESAKRQLDEQSVHRYLTQCICYDLSERHLQGLQTFQQLCLKHGFLPGMRTIRWVHPE